MVPKCHRSVGNHLIETSWTLADEGGLRECVGLFLKAAILNGSIMEGTRENEASVLPSEEQELGFAFPCVGVASLWPSGIPSPLPPSDHSAGQS